MADAIVSPPEPAPDAGNINDFLGKKTVSWWRPWLKWMALAALIIVVAVVLLRTFTGSTASQYASKKWNP